MNLNKIEDSQVGLEIHSSMNTRKIDDLRVGFADAIIREYEVTLGDNPSVSEGPPLSLGWSYNEMLPIPVDKYEEMRGKRRNSLQMTVPADERLDVLVSEWGYSIEDVEQTSQQCQKTKRRRMHSARKAHSPIHHMVKNARQKVGIAFSRGSQ
mmetsp:Transcript_4187/g.4597  ORF Transcript_4187/g.4597 Transcript_4187/m.4597 type:complete len:153 (+) Transcript_4187:188-646(+)|eukprot:CAMPEP_0194353360 /NCGR_PEP_ID=MMETSP0174-20130528/1681_1 /TAXON_ID=216777 /ORGANISM="Proboscia alata, Strain PI-D3" /LENGTH=152 /DNA_ID=CAMNT_0039121857 /DNA_START=154 /DNA_END=612 /DNA_ORIENTATION=+